MQMWTTIKKRQNTKNNKNMKTQKAERNTTDKWHGIPASLACYSSPFHTGCSRLWSPPRVKGRFGGVIGQLAVQSVADPRPCLKVPPERCEKLMTCNGGEQQRRAELIKALKMTSSSKPIAASKVEQRLRVEASVTSIYIMWKCKRLSVADVDAFSCSGTGAHVMALQSTGSLEPCKTR